MSNFTKGPWEARLDEDTNQFGIHSPDGTIFASLIASRVRNFEANANLISAAPEMYEALTNVLPFFNNHRHYERGEDAYQAVLAVLAKAEGKQS